MQSKWMKPIGAAVLAAGMAFAYAETPSNATPSNTQTPSTAPQHQRMTRQERMQHRFDRIAAYLNLTPEQKTQAKTILQQAHQNTVQVQPQLKQNREALHAAIKADNKAEIDRLSAEQGNLIGKMIATRTEAFAKIYQTLTPEQRAKADQLPSHFRAMRHEHMQNRRQG